MFLSRGSLGSFGIRKAESEPKTPFSSLFGLGNGILEPETGFASLFGIENGGFDPVCQGLEMTHVVHLLVEDANDQYSTVPLQEIEHHMASDMKYS